MYAPGEKNLIYCGGLLAVDREGGHRVRVGVILEMSSGNTISVETIKWKISPSASEVNHEISLWSCSLMGGGWAVGLGLIIYSRNVRWG